MPPAPRVSSRVKFLNCVRARMAVPQMGQWTLAKGSRSPTSSSVAQFGQGWSSPSTALAPSGAPLPSG